MRGNPFASIRVVVPKYTYSTSGQGIGQTAAPTGVDTLVVGMAQNIGISDSFGTRPVNVLGTPLPVIAPGFMTTNISIEKATIDGQSFRSLGAFNPLWAHVGATYTNPVTTNGSETDNINFADGNEFYPFMFILAVKDKVSDSYEESHLPFAGAEGTDVKAPNPVGVYACVLADARITLSSSQTVIMESATAIARPLSGTWLSQAMRSALHNQGVHNPGRNGMDDLINAPMYGYRSGTNF